MTIYSFDEVLKIDQALQQLAAYEVTRGMIVIPKSQEEFIELQEKIANKFNYFKGLIKNKECTFQFIKQKVLEENGPFPKADPINLDKIDPKQLDQIDDVKSREREVHDLASTLLKAFLPIAQDPDDDLVDKFGIKITVAPIDSLNPNPSQIDAPKAEIRPVPKKRSRKKNAPKKYQFV